MLLNVCIFISFKSQSIIDFFPSNLYEKFNLPSFAQQVAIYAQIENYKAFMHVFMRFCLVLFG